MNIFTLSFRSVQHRPLSSLLSVMLLGLGIGIIVLILLVSNRLKEDINKNAADIDLVIGAKGSPLQIILANVFHIDFPTGNIPLAEANDITRNRLIASAIPLSLGDSYKGYRIVGTTRAYMELYNGVLETGSWKENEMDAVIGADVAKQTGLAVGDSFASSHGLSDVGMDHEEVPFKVSGVLKASNSVLDDLILVTTRSVWEVHRHEEAHNEPSIDSLILLPQLGLSITPEELENEEITGILVKYSSPMGAVRLPQSINKDSNLQAASPAFETARLFNLIGSGIEVLNILGIVIICISAISVFISLFNSLKERKYELAIIRSMGASRIKVMFMVLTEGLMLTTLGIVIGYGMAHLGMILLGSWIPSLQTSWTYFVAAELEVLIGSFAIGIVASLIPAVITYKFNISNTLARG